DRVCVIDDAAMADGMKTSWDLRVAVRHIEAAAERWSVDSIITFDGYGVSGHVNHIATHRAVQAYVLKAAAKPTTRPLPLIAFQLRSPPLWEKYSGPLTVLISVPLARPMQTVQGITLTTPRGQLLASLRGMQRHASQLVWFRYLFVWFSRFSFVIDL